MYNSLSLTHIQQSLAHCVCNDNFQLNYICALLSLPAANHGSVQIRRARDKLLFCGVCKKPQQQHRRWRQPE
jgi:hypothetical protein